MDFQDNQNLIDNKEEKLLELKERGECRHNGTERRRQDGFA